MKNSDLKKERFKKGAIATGIAVGATASTGGAAYAAASVMSDDVEMPSEPLPEIEEEVDVDVEYPQDDAPADEDIFVTAPQPVYNVYANPAPEAAAPAPAVDVDAVPLVPEPEGETGPELVEFISAEVEPEAMSFDEYAPADAIIAPDEQDFSGIVPGQLTDMYLASEDVACEPDLADMYAPCDDLAGADDEILDLGMDFDTPELPEHDFTDSILQ